MKKAVFSFGRVNPPTSGHEKLVNKIREVAKRESATPFLFVSHSQDKKKNPLTYTQKSYFLKKAFGDVFKQSKSKTVIQILQELEKEGYTDVIMVVGSDRKGEFESLVSRYNGKDYQFDSIDVVSAGERDPDASDVSGMSASKLRELAVRGEFGEFEEGVPSKLSSRDKQQLYKDVRNGMGLTEMNDEEMDELEKYIDELDVDELISDMDDLFDDEEDMYIEEALTSIQRLNRARTMKRIAPKLARQRKLKAKKMAGKESLEKRARKAAIQALRKRFAGDKGENYANLSRAEKEAVDKRIESKKNLIPKIAKRLMPSVKKSEMERLKQARTQKNESQDPDIKDRKGSQPSKYHAGLATSTKEKRDAQFKKQAKMDDDNPEAYKPAPGDKSANTKPSKHTLKYKELFGEQAEGAFQTLFGNNFVIVDTSDGKDWQKETLRAYRKMSKFANDAPKNPKATKWIEQQKKARGLKERVEPELTYIEEKTIEGLKKKAEKSGISYSILKDVYDRGIAAWRTGHRPGTTPQQWAFARVNSFITGGKTRTTADRDLWKRHKNMKEAVNEMNFTTRKIDFDYYGSGLKRREQSAGEDNGVKPMRKSSSQKFGVSVNGKTLMDKKTGQPMTWYSYTSAKKAVDTIAAKPFNKGKQVTIVELK